MKCAVTLTSAVIASVHVEPNGAGEPVPEVAELELPTRENFQDDLRSVFRGAVRLVLQTVLEEVAREMMGASR